MRDYWENREHIRGCCTWARLSEHTGIWRDLEPTGHARCRSGKLSCGPLPQVCCWDLWEKRCVSSHLVSFSIGMSGFSGVAKGVSCFRSLETEFFILFHPPFLPPAMGIKSTARYMLGKHAATKLHQPQKQKQTQISGSCDPLEERSQTAEISALERQEQTPRTPRIDPCLRPPALESVG